MTLAMSVAVVLTLNFDTTLGNVAAAASTTLAVYPTNITVALAELALAVARALFVTLATRLACNSLLTSISNKSRGT
jgi:hypothetical protein